MPGNKQDMTIKELEAMKAALEADIDKLELKRAVLEGTVELLGKGQGAEPRMLTNREKTILAESLRPAHKLKGPARSGRLPRAVIATRWLPCKARQVRRPSHPHMRDLPRQPRAIRVPPHPFRPEGRGNHGIREGRKPHHAEEDLRAAARRSAGTALTKARSRMRRRTW